MTELGEGERIERGRRKTFYRTLGALFVVGLVVGGVVGASAALKHQPNDQARTSIPKPAALALILVAFMLFIAGTWRFVRAIDEVELADNLWGSTASYYVYAALFPLWWSLAKVGVVAEPNDWVIYLAALVGGGLVYLGRKVRAR